jgi:hypothetical protein
MERNKLENEFREQLNSREIKPSEMVWDKLDAMLTAEEKKSKNRFSWIYIAASFVGFLLVGTLYFTQKENTIESQRSGVVIRQSIPTNKIENHSNKISSNPENNENRVVTITQKSGTKDNKILVLKKDSKINKNNQNPVAEFSIINQNKQSIPSQTNAFTVDELLARVDKSARLNNQPNSNLVVRVNASQLLEQVDNDLEPTFRQSVFSKVADNFKAVKEAVVNRNKE